MREKNPFVIGKYSGSEYFCDRVEETKTLHKNIVNGRNVAIISQRRLGKTGLIEHFFASQDIDNEYYTFFIDIYAAKSLKEMVLLLAKEVCAKYKRPKGSIFEDFFAAVKSIKTSFSYDGNTGLPSINWSLGEINQPETTLDEILDLLEKADRPCIIAIDEFQQISDFVEDNVDALLRTKIQHCKNINFIFAGSKSHVMTNIFNSPNKPFYNSVIMMQLNAINKNVYIQFSKEKFEEYDKHVDETLVKHVYEYFHGVTWYIQLMMNEAFALTDKEATATDDLFDEVYSNIVVQQGFTFQEIYGRLTEKQKSLVVAMANEDSIEVAVTKSDFIKRHSLDSASSVQTASKSLVEKNIISDLNGKKQISDLLFREWLKVNM